MDEITERFVGDHNLSPEREREIYEYANSGNASCGATTGKIGYGGEIYGYLCNREANHTGPHIALGAADVYAIWDGSDE